MSEWEERFGAFLRDRGLTFTPERRRIAAEIFSTQGHFDIETIYDRLRRRGERVSLATIYRLIPLLIEGALIRQATDRDGRANYELLLGSPPHHHLLCSHCGLVIEFEGEAVEELLEGICDRENFIPSEYHLAIQGICGECQQKAH